MSLFNLFRRQSSAPVARERLLAVLREEILAAIAKHVSVDHDNVVVRMDRGSNVSTLEIDVELPNSAEARIAVGF